MSLVLRLFVVGGVKRYHTSLVEKEKRIAKGTNARHSRVTRQQGRRRSVSRIVTGQSSKINLI